MAMSGKILDLRNLLAIRFPQAPLLVETRLVTGSASIDQPIGGGLHSRALSRLIIPRGRSGSGPLIPTPLSGGAGLSNFRARVGGGGSVPPFWLSKCSPSS